MIIHGVLHDNADNNTVHYAASAPADRRVSFAGSGLPFGDMDQAFAHTPNRGTVFLTKGGALTIHLKSVPNAYYDQAGSVLVPPTVFLLYSRDGVQQQASWQIAPYGIPYRMLQHPEVRKDAMFYNVPSTVRSQEDIIWDSAYPCSYHVPNNFWGGGRKPPL